MDQGRALEGVAIVAVIVGVMLLLAGIVDVSSGRAGTSELISGLAATVVGYLSYRGSRSEPTS